MAKRRTGLSDMDKRIIRSMAKHSMCLAAVADEMYCHGNTVRYHVDIIRRDTGKDASQFYDLVSLLHDLGDLNTIDAVPVVRCAECEKRDKSFVSEKGTISCPYMEAFMAADDFCSYGERKDVAE